MTDQLDVSCSFFEHSHEQITYCHDDSSGLKAIIAIHSTALGPALGGTRFYPYQSEHQALADALRLSQGMTYKAALAGLDFGGGKAVIIGDPRTAKSEVLLRAYGRFVESLGGRYITACDVGTFTSDMDVVARESQHVTGRSLQYGGSGDSSILTAFGVFQGMRAVAQHRWGETSLKGRRIGVAGVGKVGSKLVGHLIDAGAEVFGTDVDQVTLTSVAAKFPRLRTVKDTAALIREPLDIYAPCALGGALNDEVVEVLTAGVVCGAANNQLAHAGIEKQLAERNVDYCVDYCVNAGGLIQVADELLGFNFDRAKLRATTIFDTTLDILDRAESESVPPSIAADRIAEQRMREVSRLKSMWLPSSF